MQGRVEEERKSGGVMEEIRESEEERVEKGEGKIEKKRRGRKGAMCKI